MPRRVVPIWSLPELRLARVVEQHVVRHDQVRVGGDAQAAEVDPGAGAARRSPRSAPRVDHDAVADRAQLAGVEDPRRDQVELERLAVADDRVAGVVAALEADHQVGCSASRSTTLPLPSSPHWAPTITSPGMARASLGRYAARRAASCGASAPRRGLDRGSRTSRYCGRNVKLTVAGRAVAVLGDDHLGHARRSDSSS